MPGLIKATLERGLKAELTEHLGYEKDDPEARFYPNSRNGTTPNTVPAEIGDLDLDIPRDRAGTFIPRLVPGGATRLDRRKPKGPLNASGSPPQRETRRPRSRAPSRLLGEVPDVGT